MATTLSRRERQIMDIIYEIGEGSARDVHEKLPDAASYSAIRAQLSILVEKGRLEFRQDNSRYIYSSKQSVTKARKSAISRLVKTFFGGSPHHAMTALMGQQAARLKEDELDELEAIIKAERERRR